MLARVARPFAVAAVVGLTSLSLVWNSGPAQALDPGTALGLLTKLAPGGGVGIAAAAPEVLAAEGAVCATGIGCAVLAGAAVGIALYSTQDTWVPWITNAFGQGTGSDALPGGGTWGSISLASFGEADDTTDVIYNVAAGGGLFNPFGEIQCKNTDTGATWQGGPESYGAIQSPMVNLHLPMTLCAHYPGIQQVSPGTWITTYVNIGQDPYLGFAHWGIPNSYISNGTPGFNPNAGTAQNVVQCRNPDGSAYTVTGTPQIINGLVEMPTCTGAPGSQPGAHGECYTLSAAPPGSPASWTPQSSTCGAAAASAAKYPNCVGNSACTYVIRVNGLPCTIGGLGCADWPARAELTPTNYECFYGPYLVNLTACNLLERAYEPANTNGTTTGIIPATAANTDGNPRTYNLPVPAIAPPTSPRVDPPADPVPDPNAPKPCTSGQACTVAPLPPQGYDCFPKGFGAFNPVSWVQQPIQCALQWAFVPSAAAVTEVSTAAGADFTNQGFGPVVTALTTDVGKVGGNGSGCDGPAVTFSAVGIVKPMHPFSACTAPMSTLAGISYAVTTVVVILGGGWAVLVAVGAGFGFNVKRGAGGDST